MKKLSLTEFKEMYEGNCYNEFTHLSNRQCFDADEAGFDFSTRYNRIFFAFNPNSIMFQNPYGSFTIHRVKHIEMDNEIENEPPSLNFVCDNIFSRKGDIRYTFFRVLNF